MRSIVIVTALGLTACASTVGPPHGATRPSPPVTRRVAVCNDLREDGMQPSSLAPDRLQRFREVAESRQTDALVVVHDGQVVLRYQRPGTSPRFEAMSVTKSVASLVFGQLVDAGLVHLDDDLARFFPSWSDDPRGKIKVRHVLEHTTGLADEKTTEAIYAHGDFVGFALEAKLERPPGSHFFYSNKASNLLAGIVRKVTGRELADVARDGFFAKLGIDDVEWWSDKAGHTQVMAGLVASADDLARIGELVRNGGVGCGRSIVSRAWVEASTRTLASPGPPHGLLWWMKPKAVTVGFDRALFDDWARTGMPQSFIDKFLPLEGRFFERKAFFETVARTLTGKPTSDDLDRDLAPWYEQTYRSGRRDGSMRSTGIASIRAEGWLGQYVLVYPDERLVVVRLRHAPADASQQGAGSFSDIEKAVDELLAPT